MVIAYHATFRGVEGGGNLLWREKSQNTSPSVWNGTLFVMHNKLCFVIIIQGAYTMYTHVCCNTVAENTTFSTIYTSKHDWFATSCRNRTWFICTTLLHNNSEVVVGSLGVVLQKEQYVFPHVAVVLISFYYK